MQLSAIRQGRLLKAVVCCSCMLLSISNLTDIEDSRVHVRMPWSRVSRVTTASSQVERTDRRRRERIDAAFRVCLAEMTAYACGRILGWRSFQRTTADRLEMVWEVVNVSVYSCRYRLGDAIVSISVEHISYHIES